jgi:gag-polypeptide of LTR copia-type
MNESSKITKLSPTNYHQWKFKIRMLLKHSNLWEIVTGKEGEPVSEGGKPPSDHAMAQWRMRQGQAFAIIALNVEDGQLVHLAGIEDDPVDAWRKLAEIHEPKSVNEAHNLLKQPTTPKSQDPLVL